jgi:hypothetical protein
VRVTATTHPLFGQLVPARDFKRMGGVLFLVVVLPDGSPGTIRADATDMLGEVITEQIPLVMDADGLRVLRQLVTAGTATRSRPARSGKDK